MQMAEANIRRRLPMAPERVSASVLLGVRYLGLPEEFDYLTQSDVPLPGSALNSIRVRTDNQLIGPQIGGFCEVYLQNRWWLNLEVKGALMNNRARQSTVYHNVNEQGLPHDYFGERQENHTAFLGDLSLTAVYRWSPHFSTRLGYQAMWINNLALATGNFNTNIDILRNGPAELRHDGRSVYHGPHAGIVIAW